ncbi:uncharacterized protein LOC122522722 [Polistes fuscatus]|uniref:uncharacterized protein LOC122522722 n=2 Tax=Polistes fuscatus TaxID=30207 RepID=UPI001CA943C2|nr:uncharacterized protein LOC122522722 [Polistes fuscatus]
MSDEKIVCFVCRKSDEHIILFSEETLKKCQTILKLRKIHKLKYKDIILPSEYTESGYHRVCYKVFTGLMKKYFTSQPLSAEKQKGKKQRSCVITSNSSSTLSSIRDLSSELPDPQSSSTESSSQLILLSQSTETQPSTSENESDLQLVPSESPTTSQPAPICESIGLQSATLQDISDVFEPEW